jgi:hypothetical protein
VRLQHLVDQSVRRVFGEGLEADLAHRGVEKLAKEAALVRNRRPERLTGIRLEPGETYKIVARPPATKAERRAARRERAAFAKYRDLTRPTRKQLKAAKRLEKVQRKLARRTPGSRRHSKALAAETVVGERFDRVMTLSPKQSRATDEYHAARDELARLRDASFERARATRRPRRSPRVRVYE